MKKKSIFSVLIALSLFFSFSLGVLAAPKVSVWFNGKSKKVSVKIINKKAYVPLKDAVSWFDGKVTYDKKKNKYTVTSKGYKAPSKAKSYNVNVTKTSGPMKLSITKVTVDPAYKYNASPMKAIVLNVKVNNTSGKTVNWYPTMDIFAFNTGEQIEDAFMYSDEMDGEFLSNTTKSGKVVLKVTNSNLDSIKTIIADIEPPFDNDYNDLGSQLTFSFKFR